MKVLSIGSDKNLFKEDSAVRQRIIEYGSLAEELHIIVFSRQKSEIRNLKSETNPKSQISKNTFIYSTNSWSRWFYILDAYKIAKRIILNSKFLIHNSLITTQDPFECGLAGYIMAKKFKLPLHLQIHGDFLSPKFGQESFLNKIRVWLAKFLIPRADKIRVVSERIKDSIISKFRSIDISKIAVLPIFVDVKRIQKSDIKINLHEKYSQFDFIILMASRLTKEKNIELAVEAIQEVIKFYPKTGLIIVGDGKEKNNLKFKIENLKLNENIIMESWIDDLSSYYKTADLFLLISNHEGWGMTSVEAMAAGCLLIMTDVGCAGEIVKNEYNGLVIPVGSKVKLIEAIERTIKEPSLHDKLKNNSLATVKNLASKEEYLNSYKKSWEMR